MKEAIDQGTLESDHGVSFSKRPNEWFYLGSTKDVSARLVCFVT